MGLEYNIYMNMYITTVQIYEGPTCVLVYIHLTYYYVLKGLSTTFL